MILVPCGTPNLVPHTLWSIQTNSVRDQFVPITNNHAGLQKKRLSSSLEQVEFLNGKKLFMLTCPMGKPSGKLSGEYKAN